MDRREFIRNLGLGGVSLTMAGCSLSSVRSHGSKQRRPNFLFLFTDDQSFNTVDALNNIDVRTPDIDRLVRRGVTFTHCYNQGAWNGAVCVASRAMLNTGRYLWECGGNDCADYPLWGRLLGDAGYDTFMTGKWHNGQETLAK